jgi:predicted ATPase
LRKPSPTTAPDDLEPNGRNLATVLARIEGETRTADRPRGVLPDIAASLSNVIPGVSDLQVVESRESRDLRVQIAFRGNPPFSSRVVSDGTLRVLALLTFLHDPKRRGVLCYEEPENGVHPARLNALINELSDLVTDLSEDPVSNDRRLSQIIINSHSPVVLSAMGKAVESQVLFADVVSRTDPENGTARPKTRFRPVHREKQQELWPDPSRGFVTTAEVRRFLSTVEDWEEPS